MRAIDADELKKKAFGKRGGLIHTADIDAMPTIKERKTGEWIRHPEQKNIFGGKTIECPVCGEKYVVQYIEDEKFCRNCGADMREQP